MALIAGIVSFLIGAYLLLLFARAGFSLIPLLVRDWRPTGLVLTASQVAKALTDPPLLLIRRVVPPLQLGGVSWDLAFVVLFALLTVLQRVVTSLAG